MQQSPHRFEAAVWLKRFAQSMYAVCAVNAALLLTLCFLKVLIENKGIRLAHFMILSIAGVFASTPIVNFGLALVVFHELFHVVLPSNDTG